MRFILTALAILISIGSTVAVRAEVTNISNQQKTTVLGNNTTTIDSKTTVVKNVKTIAKSRPSTSTLKSRAR
jgi:hypothetical protein